MAMIMPGDVCDGQADTVDVLAGETLVVSGNQVYENLCVRGTLTIADGANIKVGTLQSHEGSLIQASANGSILILDRVPSDPDQFRTGLIIGGDIAIAGTPKTAITRLTSELLTGQTTINVVESIGWLVGDEIAIPDTRDVPYGASTSINPDVFVITSISGTTITLNKPAPHDFPASRDGNGTLERFPPVGNLTRSFAIASENPSGSRGHLMITMGATGYVRNVSIRDMGRTTNEVLNLTTNVKGRYAAHLHFIDAPGFDFSGNVVRDATKWGITVHHSNGHTLSNNIVLKALGAGFMTEDGTEVANTFDHNLSMGVTGDSNDYPVDYDGGKSGHGFWFEGPGNRVTNNIGANNLENGFLQWHRHEPAIPTSFNVFTGNEAIANGKGFELWGTGGSMGPFYEWHNTLGFYLWPHAEVTVTDWYGRSDPRLLSENGYRSGGTWGDYDYQYVDTFINPDIQNKTYGIFLPYGNTSSGGDSRARELKVVGGKFNHNVYALEQHSPSGSYQRSQQRPFKYTFTGTTFSGNTKGTVLKTYTLVAGVNLLSLQQLDFVNYNGTVGDNFSVYYKQQAPDFIVPEQTAQWTGAPRPGMTNAQLWAEMGQAIAGRVAPCTDTRVGFVNAIVCAEGTIPPPPPPPPPMNTVTDLVAKHRNGQTFITFTKVPGISSYDVFRNGVKVATVDGESWHLRYPDADVGNGFVLETGATPLTNLQALLVWTPEISESAIYGVTTGSDPTTLVNAPSVSETHQAVHGWTLLEPPSIHGETRVFKYFRWENYAKWRVNQWGYYGHRVNVFQPLTAGPFPVVVTLHSAGFGYNSLGVDLGRAPVGVEIQTRDTGMDTPDPYTGTKYGHSVWFGRYDSTTDRVVPITERRITDYVKLVKADLTFQADPNRTYIQGASLGSGAMHVAAHYPTLFTAASTQIGFIDGAYTGGMAFPPGHTDLTLIDGMNVTWGQWQDMKWMADNGYPMPPIIHTFNKDDSFVSPAHYPAALAAFEIAHLPYAAEWRPGNHAGFAIANQNWSIFRFKSNEAYPAFSNATSSDAFDEPIAGQRNAKLGWSNVLDTPTRLEMDLTGTGDVDVTLRNVQAFTGPIPTKRVTLPTRLVYTTDVLPPPPPDPCTDVPMKAKDIVSVHWEAGVLTFTDNRGCKVTKP